MPIRLPSYLYRNRYGIFYFRVTPPADLRTRCGYRETRISLRTPDRVVAVSVARHLTIRIEGLWKALRHMDEKESKASPAFMLFLKETQRRIREEEKAIEAERLWDEERAQLKAEIATVRKDAVTAGYLRGLKDGAERAGTAPTSATTKTSASFSQVAAAHILFKETKKEWRPKTTEENQAIYDLFVAINGDHPIADIDRDVSTRHLATLQKLPANRAKIYPGKSISEVLALKPVPMSKRSVNKHMERLSSVFKWAMGDKKYGVTHKPTAKRLRLE